MNEEDKSDYEAFDVWRKTRDALRMAPVDIWIAACQYRDSKAAQAEPVAWKHDCAVLCMNDVELWVDRCPHCGKPRHPAPAVAVNEVLLSAAKKYFMAYCQDEASEFGVDDTGCSQEQHRDAVQLRDAIAAAEAERNKGGV